MVVPVMANVCWVIVSVIPALVGMIAAKVCARSCVRSMVNILMVNVFVILAGKVKSVHCVMMNVKWPIVMVTGIASVASVNVCAAIKENSVKKVKSKSFKRNHFNFYMIFLKDLVFNF